MAFSNLSEVVPTVNAFLAHWGEVNAALGGGPLVLPGSYSVASLTADRNTLNTLFTDVVVADNERQIAAAARDLRRAALRERLRQFRGVVQGMLAGSVYVRALPKLPATNAKEQDFLRAMDDMRDLWNRINAGPPAGFAPPLLLVSGYAAATFALDVAALRTQYADLTSADEAASFARKIRDVLIATVKTRLIQYRKAVAGTFAAGSALIESLPAVSPAPGSTPEPVRLAGTWDAPVSMADLLWTASDNPALDHYSVRYHPGPKYKAAEEQAVEVVAPDTLTLKTAFGLVASGSVSWFKVYVVTSTGNEKGSNSVRVMWP